jgi:hypothetical protein
MIEGENLVEEHEAGVGKPEVVGGVDGQALDLADHVVAEEADGAGGEGGKAGDAGGGVSFEGVTEEGKDIAGEVTRAAVLDDFYIGPMGDDAAAGTDTDVGVAAEVFTAFDGLKEEAFGLGGGEAKEGGDGSFKVGGQCAIERDEGMGAGQAQELGASGMGWPHCDPW